jgi:zinc transporter ZupT
MSIESLIFGAATFFSTLFGGLFAAKFRKRFGLIAAFAGGVLIAVPLFDLLPESLKLAGGLGIPVENVMYAMALGFIFLLFLERYLSVHRICVNGECRNVRHPRGGLFGASELSVHSFLDGVAIGLGFQLNLHVGIIIAFAVIAHDFSDGINTVTVMLKAGNSLKRSLRMLLIDAVAPVLGVIFTLFFDLPDEYLVYLLPFFAGGFFYLGASDLLPEAHERNPPLASVIITILGFLVIFVVTRFLNV